MAHLLHVSPSGNLNQIAGVTQNTAGVTGSPEERDHLGFDTVLANLDPGSTVATPATAVWAVAARYEVTARGNNGAVHVFPPGWRPGQSDIFIEDGDYGLPADAFTTDVSWTDATVAYLYLGNWDGRCHGIPWGNILNGGQESVMISPAPCR